MQDVSDDTRFPSDVRWIPLDEVADAGAYISRSSGHLVRIVAAGRPLVGEELLEEHNTAPVYLTRVSTDPFVPITRARMAAANRDIEVHF